MMTTNHSNKEEEEYGLGSGWYTEPRVGESIGSKKRIEINK